MKIEVSKEELKAWLIEWKSAVKSYDSRAMRLMALRDKGIIQAKKKLEERIKRYSLLLNSD